jgi:RNA 3'-terminal phosphate cyclase (ATP)
LGQRGKTAERVADEAVLDLLEYLDSPGVVDPRAADQLITIAALSPRESYFTTTRITQHLLTNAEVIRKLTGRNVIIEGSTGEGGSVTIEATR